MKKVVAKGNKQTPDKFFEVGKWYTTATSSGRYQENEWFFTIVDIDEKYIYIESYTGIKKRINHLYMSQFIKYASEINNERAYSMIIRCFTVDNLQYFYK